MIEPGDIMKQIGVGPGQHMTKEGLVRLQSYWLEIYMVFQILLTRNPETLAKINTLKEKLAEANELITDLVDNSL